MKYYIFGGFKIDPDTITSTSTQQVSAEKWYLMMLNRYMVGLQYMVNLSSK